MNASHKILYLVANTRHTPSNDTVIEYHFQWDLIPDVKTTHVVLATNRRGNPLQMAKTNTG